jgi:DNA-directed RNA polymerase specialized sigma24 family protein
MDLIRETRSGDAMTFLEALKSLRVSSTASAAYDFIFDHTRAVVQRQCGLQNADLDDVVSTSLFRVVKAMELGQFDPQSDAVARAYVVRAARNAAVSLLRSRKRSPVRLEHDSEALADAAGATADDDWSEDPEVVRLRSHQLARDRLDPLAQRALERRKADHRLSLKEAYDQLIALRFGDATMDDFLREAVGDAANDAAHVRQVRNRLYKAHERCRTALHQAWIELDAAGTLSPEEAAQSRACLRLL